MQINGLGSVQAAQSLNGVQRKSVTGPSPGGGAPATLPADQLDLSPEAQALSEAQGVGQAASDGIRWDRVQSLRQQIADGSFETTERLAGTVDKLLDAYA